VASFFVSRVDSEIDKQLGDGSPLRGQAAIANARLAYQHYEQVFASDRWKALESAGAKPQRPLWASTGVKDPAYDDTQYVVELVAPAPSTPCRRRPWRPSPTTARSAATR
jgi:transaldolase